MMQISAHLVRTRLHSPPMATHEVVEPPRFQTLLAEQPMRLRRYGIETSFFFVSLESSQVKQIAISIVFSLLN